MTRDLPFRDRRHAGQVLAQRLRHWRERPGLLVLALPRGGVPVGDEVARALDAPLDVLVVRKLGAPWHPEFAIGALASGGVRVLQPEADTLPNALLERLVRKEQAELERRERLYRGERPPASVAGRSVILVDDGLATGATMQAAAEAVQVQKPAALCVAVPVGAADSCRMLAEVADEVVCAETPEPFRAVSLWYRDFPQTSDDEVRSVLAAALQRATHGVLP
ncbi:MAG TPA: phosphoribosyltransferase [Ramlibacter sp.]